MEVTSAADAAADLLLLESSACDPASMQVAEEARPNTTAEDKRRKLPPAATVLEVHRQYLQVGNND